MNVRSKSLREAVTSLTVIGILGSIFFPLVAATPARQVSAELASLKQLGAAIQLYTNDWDGVMPLTIGWSYDQFVPVPVDSRAGDTSQMIEANRSVWVNSTLPYYKNRSNLAIPGARLYNTGTSFVGGTSPVPVGINMNGLLNRYSFDAMMHPSRVPLLWESMGDVNVYGLALSNPVLQCSNSSPPCRYDGLFGDERSVIYGSYGPEFTVNGTTSFLMSDLNVMTLPQRGAATALDYLSPWAEWNADGTIYAAWMCGNYPCFFMPDVTWFDPGLGAAPSRGGQRRPTLAPVHPLSEVKR